MTHKKPWIISAGVLLLLAGSGLGLNYYRQQGYETFRPKKGQVTEAVYGLGKVKSVHRFEVRLGVVSTVERLYVQEGQAVRKGDKLIEFDSGAVFRAPFAGTITLIAHYEGETAVPQLPVLRLEDLTDRFIELSLEQEGALRIQVGQPARISFESLRGQTLNGKVHALFSRDDEFLAHIKVAQLQDSVLPGMTADVTIEIGTNPNAILVPVSAISNGMLTVRRGGKLEKIRAEIGNVDGVMAEIKGDSLTLDDEVLIRKAKR